MSTAELRAGFDWTRFLSYLPEPVLAFKFNAVSVCRDSYTVFYVTVVGMNKRNSGRNVQFIKFY